MAFSDNLKKIMRDKKITAQQIADKLETSRGTVTHWSNGVRFPQKESDIEDLANTLDVSIQELFNPGEIEQITKKELKNNPNKYSNDITSIEDADKVNATYYEDIYACMGSNEVVNGESNTSIMVFDRKFLEKEVGKYSYKNLSVVKTIGDSMEPTIQEGELLLISPFTNDQMNILSGSVYLITINDKPFIKRLSEHPLTGNIEVYSDNERHPSFNITKDNIDKLKIIGRVLANFNFL